MLANNRITGLFAFVIILIALLPFSFGLGISPGKATVDFEPGMTKTFKVDIYNNENQEMLIKIHLTGYLSEYITLSTDELNFSADDKIKGFSYSIRMPENIERPGTHTAEIIFTALKSADDTKSLNINVNTGVKTLLDVKVPYPGLYAYATLQTKDVKPGQDIEFYIAIANLGKNDIEEVWADIKVSDPDDNEIASLTTEPISIDSKKRGKLLEKLSSTELLSGDYYVDALLHYDEKEIDLKSRFSIDEFLIKLLSAEADEYSLGSVAKFSINVENIGNRPVRDFYTTILLNDEKNNEIADLESIKINIDKAQATESIIFWDTKNIQIGEFTGKLGLQYENKDKEHNITVVVREDGIEINLIEAEEEEEIKEEPIIEPEILPEDRGLTRVHITIAVLILAIVFLIILLVELSRKK